MEGKKLKVFRLVEQLDQGIKSFFMCIFLDLARVYIGELSMSRTDFVAWLSLK